MGSSLTPISFEFVAAGVARRVRTGLARLKPSQVNREVPSWEGHGGIPETRALKMPLTDMKDWEGRYVLTEITLVKENDEKLVVNDATVSVSREKHVVSTSLVGMAGTVKEYVSSGDYDISLSVGIVAVDAEGRMTDEYPADGIRKVKEFLDEDKALGVASVFFGMFGISRIVVTGFSLRQETDSNRQVIEIKALSDEDYVIKSEVY